MALRRALLQVAVLAVALLALLPAVATADPAWLAPVSLDPGRTGTGSPDVAAAPDGDAAVAWVGQGSTFQPIIRARARPRGGPWEPTQDLETTGVFPREPKVTAFPNGDFIAVWISSVGGQSGQYLRWARHTAADGWSDPRMLAPAGTEPELLDLQAGGTNAFATVLWTDNGSPATNDLFQDDDLWGARQQVPSSPSSQPVLDVAPNGSAVTVWSNGRCGSVGCVEAAWKLPGGQWGPVEPVAASGLDVTAVAVTARPDGTFAVAWAEDQPSSRSQDAPGVVRSAIRPIGEGGTPWRLPELAASYTAEAAGCPFEAGCVDIAAGPDGTLVAAWQEGNGQDPQRISAALRPPDGPWGGTENVGDTVLGSSTPQVAITQAGTAVVVWNVNSGASGAVVRGAHRGLNGTWDGRDLGTPAPNSETSTGLQDVAVDEEGNAATAWTDPGGVWAAGFDGVGPRFSAFSVPASGAPGGTLAFAAAADDNWSGPASISWLFSDGGTAPGDTVNHAFAAAGEFTATATATDGIGNTSRRSGTVGVTAAATPVATPTATPDPCGTTDRDKDGIEDGCDDNNGAARPRPFKTVNATVVSGEVFVKLPARAARASQAKVPKGFVRLEGAETIPVGSTLDTAKGRVRLRSASDTRKHTQRADFFRGRFVVRQVRKPRGKAKRRSTKLITDIVLNGSSFRRACRTTTASVSQKRRRSRKRVRRLFGDGKGRFRTSGRNAAATVRGTRWGVQDRCDGTLVTVQRGRVSVRDLVRRRTVIVRTGHKYLARRR